MKSTKNKIIMFTLFVVGLSLFIYFLYKFGTEAMNIIKLNINFYYLGLFMFIVLISFVPYVMRYKVILDSFGTKISLFTLIKQTIAGSAVSYVTPASRLGGEPVRIYMLKKECDIDYETGTSSIILDKFVEILGSVLYGVIGFILLISLIGVPLYFRIIFGSVILLGFGLLFFVYYKSKKDKNIFFTLIRLFRLNKFIKLKESVKRIDVKIGNFFKYKKKILLKSFMYYLISGLFFIVQFKFLLLSIGFDASLFQLVLIINIWGLLNFVPTPSSLGFLEAGQATLFNLMQGNSAEGLAMVLLLRGGYVFIACIGFFILTKFGFKQIFKYKNDTPHI